MERKHLTYLFNHNTTQAMSNKDNRSSAQGVSLPFSIKSIDQRPSRIINIRHRSAQGIRRIISKRNDPGIWELLGHKVPQPQFPRRIMRPCMLPITT